MTDQLIEDSTARYRHELTQLYRAARQWQAQAEHWKSVADGQRKELDELLHIIGTSTPIAAFDLATTWKAEKAHMQEELSELRASATLAVERWKRSETIRRAAIGYIDELREAAETVINSAERDDNNLTPDMAAALRALTRCVSSTEADQGTAQLEETQLWHSSRPGGCGG